MTSSPKSKCDDMMRSRLPVTGTPLRSVTSFSSLAKSTSSCSEPMSLPASAAACRQSRHMHCVGGCGVAVKRYTEAGVSASRKATLKKAAGALNTPLPPGVVADDDCCGSRYVPVAAFHSPTPAVMRTTELPGFHSARGTRMVICARLVSMLTGTAVPSKSAVPACTVRKWSAGPLTLAP